MAGAFEYSVSGDGAGEPLDLLVGHEYGRPLASRAAGSLTVAETGDALVFEATLPAPEARTTWMRDALLAVDQGLMAGLSPGFTVPPASVVPGAERLDPEPGNPGVTIRTISAAVLHELSLVTRAAYRTSAVGIRSAEPAIAPETGAEELLRWL